MGAGQSNNELTSALAACDKNIMKHVLGQPAAEIKRVFQRFEETSHAVAGATASNADGSNGSSNDSSSGGDSGTTVPQPAMEDVKQFARMFGSRDRNHEHWVTLYTTLGGDTQGKVDFYEAIATLVRSVCLSVFSGVDERSGVPAPLLCACLSIP